jgi:hypothetical protein
LVGGSENLLGALFGYHFGVRTSSTAEPILHVTPAILGSLKAQRFATQQRHRFGLYFAEAARRDRTVSEIYLSAMAQYYVTKFVAKSLKRQLRKRVNCYRTLLGEALNISVRVIEWNALNTQCGKRSLGIPLRERNWLNFLPVSLAQSKPASLINKAGKGVFLVRVFLAAFASDRHAQSECSFATFYKTA